MTKWKKKISILFVFSFVLLLFSGCSDAPRTFEIKLPIREEHRLEVFSVKYTLPEEYTVDEESMAGQSDPQLHLYKGDDLLLNGSAISLENANAWLEEAKTGESPSSNDGKMTVVNPPKRSLLKEWEQDGNRYYVMQIEYGETKNIFCLIFVKDSKKAFWLPCEEGIDAETAEELFKNFHFSMTVEEYNGEALG